MRVIDMQMQLGSNIHQKVKTARVETDKERAVKLEAKRVEDEKDKLRAEQKAIFEKSFMQGATSVIKQLGKYYFCGDISHNTSDNIFHNALAIMKQMKNTGKSYGHMNYSDPPTYDEKPKWQDWNEQRRNLYKEDLFMFDENEYVCSANDGLDSYIKEVNKKSIVNAITALSDAPSGRVKWQPDKKY